MNDNRAKVRMKDQHDSLLLRLSREILDEVYRNYFHEEGGYCHEPQCDKCRTALGHKIDLSLVYSCQRVASETQGLPF